MVVHPTKLAPAKPGAKLSPPSLHDISGSSNWANKADFALTVQAMQDEATARGDWLMWFVTTDDADHPGEAVAWATKADPHGGARMQGVLVAHTPDELRAMLPAGLTCHDRTPMMPAGVLEAWD